MKKPENMKMVAKAFSGLENVLAEELKALGAQDIEIGRRAVIFSGDKELMYRVNYHARTTLRILKPILKWKLRNAGELYNVIRKINWPEYFDVNKTIVVDSNVNSSLFNHSKFVSQKVKDAIVDCFRDKYNRRPDVNLEDPDIRIDVHIAEKELTLSLDSSGESLHKRGYRKHQVKAPLNEVLAAGMLMLAGWNGRTNFVDPMCGSGTLLIEAAFLALCIPPGKYRNKYAFQHWNDYDKALFDKICRQPVTKSNFSYEIVGTDISTSAIRDARENIVSAGLSDIVRLKVAPVQTVIPPSGGGLLVTNPPYGERLKKTDMEGFYKAIGDSLKHNFAGYDAWILSSNFAAMKHIGLRTSKRITLFNSQLECKYYKYSLY